MIFTFTDYLAESEKQLEIRAAGLAIIWEGKLLLIHPSDASWKNQPFGIPKGGIEDGEDLLTCAIRETREETGITVDPELIDKNEKYFVFYRRGIPHSRCAYFEVHINSLEQIGLDSEKVPKEQLQAEEVDWAGFIPVQEAVNKLSRSQQIIAQRLIETIE